MLLTDAARDSCERVVENHGALRGISDLTRDDLRGLLAYK
jgi:hypothetical protein